MDPKNDSMAGFYLLWVFDLHAFCIMQDPVGISISRRVDKYTPFINFDYEKMRSIAYEKFKHSLLAPK